MQSSNESAIFQMIDRIWKMVNKRCSRNRVPFWPIRNVYVSFFYRKKLVFKYSRVRKTGRLGTSTSSNLFSGHLLASLCFQHILRPVFLKKVSWLVALDQGFSLTWTKANYRRCILPFSSRKVVPSYFWRWSDGSSLSGLKELWSIWSGVRELPVLFSKARPKWI